MFSVIIPHLNQPDQLEACLTSLDNQTIDRSLFEVIVVDNGSISPLNDQIARHSAVRLFVEPKPGPGPARNRGVQAALGDVLCFIDADCRAQPDWLVAASRAISSVPEKTVLGGDVRIPRRDSAAFTAVEAYECVFAYRQKHYIDKQGFSVLANVVMRRTDFETIGPFCGIDLAEDLEWGLRAHTCGYVYRYIPDMIVFHAARRSIAELLVKWNRHIHHSFNMARGKPWWRVRWIVRALAVLCSPAVDWVQIVTTKRVHGVLTRFEAFAVLISLRSYRAFKMLAMLGSKKGILWNRKVVG